MTIVEVFLSVLLISASVLCIYLVISLVRFSKKLDKMLEDINLITEKAVPTLDKLQLLGEKMISLADDVNRQIQIIDELLNNVKEKMAILSFKGLREKFGEEVPAMALIKNLKAVSRGIAVFFENLRK